SPAFSCWPTLSRPDPRKDRHAEPGHRLGTRHPRPLPGQPHRPPRHLPRLPVHLPQLRRPRPRLRPLPSRRRLRHHGRLLRPRTLHHPCLKGHHAHRPHHLRKRRPPHRPCRRAPHHRLRPRRCRHVRRGVPPPRPGRRLGPRRGLRGAVPVRRP